MSDQLYCYHCRTYHPSNEMRQIDTKGGKRWRCIESILRVQRFSSDLLGRTEFGEQRSSRNRTEAQIRARMFASKKILEGA